jgi:hypothetical protein
MKNIKKMTAIIVLAAVATLSTPQAFAGQSRTPSKTGWMLGDRTSVGLVLSSAVGLVLSSMTGLVLSSNN